MQPHISSPAFRLPCNSCPRTADPHKFCSSTGFRLHTLQNNPTNRPMQSILHPLENKESPVQYPVKKKGFVKNITVSNVYIPGQGCSLHFLDSSECPIHVSPPCRGKLHSRVRFCMPPPQVTEQLSHPFQFFHEPSTKMTRWIMQIDRERDYNHYSQPLNHASSFFVSTFILKL